MKKYEGKLCTLQLAHKMASQIYRPWVNRDHKRSLIPSMTILDPGWLFWLH